MSTAPRPARALCLAAVLAIAAPLAAQSDSRDQPPAEIVNVSFGWDNTMPAERWAPVRVDVRGGPAPFAGELILEYEQDAVERARVVLPIATTPGQTVPFEMAACMPGQIQVFTLRLVSGRFVQKLEVRQGDPDSALPFPQIDTQPRRVLIVGESSSLDAFSVDAVSVSPQGTPTGPNAVRGMYYQGQATPPDVWELLTPVRTRLVDLPLGWLCYDSVDAVVAKAEDLAHADSRARSALMTWVEAGGRLIVEADGAGDSWIELVGPGVLDIAPLKTLTTGSWAGSDARSLSARAIRPTPAGLFDGWDVFWPVAGDGGAGLGARGPVGAGMVTVLGVDPRRLPAMVSKEDTRRLWRPLFTGDGIGILPKHVRTVDPNWQTYMWMSSSGADAPQMNAIRTTLDNNAQLAPFGDAAFVVIAGAVLLLAACIGPLDAVILRRRAVSRWSWLSAIGWISAASILAYAAPMVMRSGESIVSRTRVVDVIDDGTRRGAWTTALTSVFAGQPLRVEYPTSDGSWWRGVSPVQGLRGSTRTFAPVITRLSATDPRSLTPDPVPQGQWTYRALLQRGAGQDISEGLPRITARKTAAGYLVTATGAGESAEVRSGVLSTREGHWTLEFNAQDGTSTWVAESRGADGLRDTPPSWQLTSDAWEWSQWPAAALQLPGVRDRADAAASRVAAGGWACVTMEIAGARDAALPLIPDSRPKEVTVVRALVRIEPEDHQP